MVYLIYLILVCVCVLSALALAVRPRMDAEEAACIWLLNRHHKKHRERHYWLNPYGMSAQSLLIGWHTANGAARYSAATAKGIPSHQQVEVEPE